MFYFFIYQIAKKKGLCSCNLAFIEALPFGRCLQVSLYLCEFQLKDRFEHFSQKGLPCYIIQMHHIYIDC